MYWIIDMKMNIVSLVSLIFLKLWKSNDRKRSTHAVIFISKKDFMAGADIKSFQIEKEGDFKPFKLRDIPHWNELKNLKTIYWCY